MHLLSTRLSNFRILAAVSVAAGGLLHSEALADEERLLQTLVQKHVLTEKEAADIQQEDAEHDQANSLNKLKLSNSLTEMRLYGDIRERYEYSVLKNAYYPPQKTSSGALKPYNPTGDQNSRWRFRLRIDADFKFGEQWFGGFELATGVTSDSSNQTYSGEFSKYSIYVSKAYLGYQPNEWLMFEIGKATNPFYTTELVWDPDVNPSGIFEQVRFDQIGVERAQQPHAMDGKSVVEHAGGADRHWELSLVAGQLFYNDNNEGGGTDPNHSTYSQKTDAYVFETQAIASYWQKGWRFTLAPAWLIENAASLSGANNAVPFEDSKNVIGASRDLNLILAPGDISFKVAGANVKVYWDFAYNTQGNGRFDDVYHLANTTTPSGRPYHNSHGLQDDIAWLAGIQIGQNSHRGDLSLLFNFRQTGISSVDPNLNDNEFALGFMNTQGYKIALAYNITDFAILQIAWYQAWQLHKGLLFGEATTDNAIANENSSKLLQVDFNVKF